jgi:hypothetical protein
MVEKIFELNVVVKVYHPVFNSFIIRGKFDFHEIGPNNFMEKIIPVIPIKHGVMEYKRQYVNKSFSESTYLKIKNMDIVRDRMLINVI